MDRQELGVYLGILLISVILSQHIQVTLSAFAFVGLAAVVSGAMYTNSRALEEADLGTLVNKRKALSEMAGVDLVYLSEDYVNLFYRVRHFNYYSKGYALSLRHTNNFLRLLTDFRTGELAECKNTVNVATGVYRSAMNSFHSIVFGIPSVKRDLLGISHTKVMNELQVLLLSDLTEIKATCPGTTDLRGPKENYSQTELSLETNYDIFM